MLVSPSLSTIVTNFEVRGSCTLSVEDSDSANSFTAGCTMLSLIMGTLKHS